VTQRYLPGDIVVRRKGFVWHKGIALGDGRVFHNRPFRGEHVSSEVDFRAGYRLRVLPMPYAARERALRLAARFDHPRRRYDLINNNCEHTVTRLASGRAHSPQLRGMLTGLAAGAVALAVTRHPAIAVGTFAAVRRWVAGRH
jgi:hypothetical protein